MFMLAQCQKILDKQMKNPTTNELILKYITPYMIKLIGCKIMHDSQQYGYARLAALISGSMVVGRFPPQATQFVLEFKKITAAPNPQLSQSPRLEG